MAGSSLHPPPGAAGPSGREKIVAGSAGAPVEAFVGVGSNLDRPRERCAEAVDRLRRMEGVLALERSSWYATSPVGPVEQPDFVNGVVRVRTRLDPFGLLGALKGIEASMGRAGGVRWGPRVIDLDLLLFGGLVSRERGLVIPHPEMHRRRFVLAPLCDLAPDGVHPVLGKTFRELLSDLGEGQRVSLLPD